ncbi:MAG: pur operon repressor [Acetilactobacillus jinshanensis]
MAVKRRDRLINITSFLLEHPNHPVTAKSFIEKYGCAKSSLSKDIKIIRHNFATRGIGRVHTQVGATGGVTYTPKVSPKRSKMIVSKIIRDLNNHERYLPGGYVYMSDILSQPYTLEQIGDVVATQYLNKPVDKVLTMNGKGLIAPSVAKALGVSFISSAHHSKISDGATINVNYFSASSHQLHNLVLPQRSLKDDSHVLIVDDYLKEGSTINGMINLIKAFHCKLAGIAILADGSNGHFNFNEPYQSLIKIKSNQDHIKASLGNLFNKNNI